VRHAVRLEQERLAAHGEQALRNAGALTGDLLGMNILPGVLADTLPSIASAVQNAAHAAI
jgi:hypothetical protein